MGLRVKWEISPNGVIHLANFRLLNCVFNQDERLRRGCTAVTVLIADFLYIKVEALKLYTRG